MHILPFCEKDTNIFRYQGLTKQIQIQYTSATKCLAKLPMLATAPGMGRGGGFTSNANIITSLLEKTQKQWQ